METLSRTRVLPEDGQEKHSQKKKITSSTFVLYTGTSESIVSKIKLKKKRAVVQKYISFCFFKVQFSICHAAAVMKAG